VKWIFELGHQVRISPPLGSDGTLYVSSHDQRLYAIGEAFR